MLPAAAKRMGIPYREKEVPYPLVTISGDPITYKDGIIWLKAGPLSIKLKRRIIEVSFNILLLGKDEAVLGMLFL